MNKHFIFPLLFFTILLTGAQAYSQEHFSIKEYVYNNETQEPVGSASIRVLNTSMGTSSGIDGHFELRLAKGEFKITISLIGYASREIKGTIVGFAGNHLYQCSRN